MGEREEGPSAEGLGATRPRLPAHCFWVGSVIHVRRRVRGKLRTRSLGTASVAEARARVHQVYLDLAAESASPPPSLTLGPHLEDVLRHVWHGRSWIAQARTALREATRFLGADRELATLTNADLHRYAGFLAARKLAASTIGLRLSLLQQALAIAGLPVKLLFAGIRKPRSAARDRVVEEGEQKGLLESLPPAERELAEFLLLTGLRISEAMAARPSAAHGRWLRVVGKGRRARRIPLTPRAAALLASCRWASFRGKNHLQGLMRSLQLGVTPHTFRHTFATRLAEKGVSPKVLAALLGDSVGVTMRYYVTARPAALEAAVELVPSI